MPVTSPRYRRLTIETRICAYCANPASYEVANESGTLTGYCCDEPTHWSWLVESVRRAERADP